MRGDYSALSSSSARQQKPPATNPAHSGAGGGVRGRAEGGFVALEEESSVAYRAYDEEEGEQPGVRRAEPGAGDRARLTTTEEEAADEPSVYEASVYRYPDSSPRHLEPYRE